MHACMCASSPTRNMQTALGLLEGLTWRVLEVTPKDADQPIHAILIHKQQPPQQAQGQLPPLVVMPHGGPHSAYTTAFSATLYAFMASLGYTLLVVNYRGSIVSSAPPPCQLQSRNSRTHLHHPHPPPLQGFGTAALSSLPGKVGTQDVADVLQATKAILDMTPAVVDRDRVGVVGGSHGGFLGAHMVGQHADVYKVAALRNPVTNIAGMSTVTDIPDWCACCGVTRRPHLLSLVALRAFGADTSPPSLSVLQVLG